MTTDELPRLPVMFEWIMGQGPYKEADGSLYTFETGYRAYLAFQDVIFRRSPSSIEMRTGRQSQPVAQQPPAEPLPTAYDTIVYKMSSRSFHRALNEGVPIPGSNRLIIMDMPALPHHPPDERRGMRSKAVWRNLPPGYLSNTILKLFIEQVTGEQQRPVPVHEARISLVSPQGRKRPITHHWVFFNCVPAMYKSPDQSEGRARQRLIPSLSKSYRISLVTKDAHRLPMLPKDFEGWMPDRPYRGVQGHFYAFLPGYAGFLEYYDVVWAQSAVPGSNVPETLYERPSHMYHEALESGIRIGNLHLKMMAAARPHCPREHGRGIQLRALWESLPAGLKSETVLMLRIYRFSYREWPQEVHATVVVTNS